jgi:WD40 repeat protein
MRTDWPPAGEGGQGFVPSRSGNALVTYSNDQAAIWQRRSDTWALSHRNDRISHDRIGIFSKDEEYLIVPVWRNVVRTFRLSDGMLMNEMREHSAMVNGLSVSPSGDKLATASNDSSVRVFGFPSGESRHNLLGHIGRVWRVAWSPTGDSLASVGTDGTARIWDLSHGSLPTPLRSPEQKPRSIQDFAFLQDGRHVNVVYNTGDSELWDIETGGDVPCDQVPGPRLDRDGSLSGSTRFHYPAYALLPQWDAQTWANPSLLHRLPEGDLERYDSCARLIADGSQVMHIDGARQRKWSLDPFQIIEDHPIDPGLKGKTLLDISHDGQKACSMRGDKWVEVYNLTNHTVADLVRDPAVKMACFSPDGGRILVTPGGDYEVYEFDARTGARIRVFSTRGTTAANYSGDGQRIGIASNLGFLTVFDAVTGEETLRLDTDFSDGLMFAANHRSLLVHDGRVVYCWPGKDELPP